MFIQYTLLFCIFIIGLSLYEFLYKRKQRSKDVEYVCAYFNLSQEMREQIKEIEQDRYVLLGKISISSIKRAAKILENKEELTANELIDLSYELSISTMCKRKMKVTSERRRFVKTFIKSFVLSLDYNTYEIERRENLR